MTNQVMLTFAGDTRQLEKATGTATKSVTDASDAFVRASKESAGFTDRIGRLGAGITGMSDAVDNAGAAVAALARIQSAAADRAQEHARALNDVAQAQQDMRQATRDATQAQIDSGQAQIDMRQATLDAQTAQRDYTAAVKEHGVNSAEAMQASIDLAQAQADLRQAQEDAKQASEDGRQAMIDQTGAQLDLNEANRAANPPKLERFAQDLQMITPILTGLVGIVGLATAAQWLWNIAMTANPVGIIIVAVAALIAVIVLIATKTTWFQDLWHTAWGGIKSAAVAVWDWLKGAANWLFTTWKKVGDFVFAPFRWAFNKISDAWNNTVGNLRWTVPKWVPGVGGMTIAAPRLPKFHAGGVVPGLPGQEVLAILQAGETVTPRGGAGGGTLRVVIDVRGGTDADRAMASWWTDLRRRGLVSVT